MVDQISLIVKPTHRCNLSCKYCYIEESAESGDMSQRTLEKMIEQVGLLPHVKSVHFIWHGGEPLLMGLDFYRQVVDLQTKYLSGKYVKNGMQSNATLVNDETLSFCEKYDLDIGSSLDGPKEIHNLTRVYGNGKGSFDDVWRGIQMIQSRNEKIRKSTPKGKQPRHLGGGAITILTKHNLDRLEEVYDFFKTNNMGMKINPLIKSGKATGSYEELGIGPAEYGSALVSLFDRWFNEEERGIDVDPLSGIMNSLITKKPSSCNFGESCRNKFISIGPQGDVYPCGRFDGIREFWLGNLNEMSLFELIQSEKNQTLRKRTADTVEGCLSCEHKGICNAGCMHNAFMQRGNVNDKDYYCASYKLLFDHLTKTMNKELERAVLTSEEKEEYKRRTDN
jgi:uncharacterized protein